MKLFGTEEQKQKFLPRLAAGEISAFLLTERCQEAQGFLYAKPLPAEDFTAYLRTRHLALHVDKLDKRLSRTRSVQRRAGKALASRRFPRT